MSALARARPNPPSEVASPTGEPPAELLFPPPEPYDAAEPRKVGSTWRQRWSPLGWQPPVAARRTVAEPAWRHDERVLRVAGEGLAEQIRYNSRMARP